MNSITQDTRYLPHETNTHIYAVESYMKGNSVNMFVESIIFLKLHLRQAYFS